MLSRAAREEGYVRIDIPLLPISIEIHQRRLRPLRGSIRGLMAIIVLAGLFFWLVSELGRLNRAANYHVNELSKIEVTRKSSPYHYGTTQAEKWHEKNMSEYRAAHERIDLLVFILVVAFASIGVIAVLGRVIDGLSRRSVNFPEPNHPNPS
jgi:hypothetical protein